MTPRDALNDETIRESLWMATTGGPSFSPLRESIEVDAAVIGAGIAGLTTAVLLKQAGLRVAVLEAREICSGATGYTTAKVTAQHGLIYDTLRAKHGLESAQTYARANEDGLEQIARLAEQGSIDCDFDRRAAYVYAEDDSGLASIEREVEAARAAGLPAEFTESTDLRWPVRGAVRLDHQAQFHPRRFCLGLAALVDGDGSRVFEQTRALDVDGRGP